MFRLATLPARHPRRLAATTLAGTPSPSLSPSPSPSPSRLAPAAAAAAAAAGRRSASKKPFKPVPKERGSMRDVEIPRRSFASFKARHMQKKIQHTTPEEAYHIYSEYIKALSQRRRDPYWEEQFIWDTKASPVAVHDTAVFVGTFPYMDKAETHLLFHLLNTASGMGYDASALSLARHLLFTEAQKTSYFSYNAPPWSKMRERIAALIKAGRDANAVVIEGLIHLNRHTKNDDYLALDAFKRAAKIALDTVHFDWYASCYQGMGEAQLRLGLKEDAAKSFAKIISHQFHVGYLCLAKLQPEHPKYVEWLTKVAALGNHEAMELLVNEHMRRSEKFEEESKPKEAETDRLHALQWARMLQHVRQK